MISSGGDRTLTGRVSERPFLDDKQKKRILRNQFQILVMLDPNNIRALHGYAYLLKERGFKGRAEEMYRRASVLEVDS